MSLDYDVFLAYSSEDGAAVEAIALRLQDVAGLRLFLDKWDVMPGESWIPRLEVAIAASKTFAVFFSPGSRGGWREEERQYALRLAARNPERRIIPVLLPGASEHDIDPFLRSREWVDLAREDGFARLVAGITGRRPGPPAKLPEGRPAPSANEPDSAEIVTSTNQPFPWPIFLALMGMLAFWAWGLQQSTTLVLPWFWTPLIVLGSSTGIVCLLLARSSPERRGWLVEALRALRVFLREATAESLLHWASRMLDRFYGDRILSWHAFRRSARVSLGAALILAFVLAFLLGEAVWNTSSPTSWWPAAPLVGLAWCVLNVVSDFASVASTRRLLRLVRRYHSGRHLAVMLVVDTLILLILALVPTGLAGSAITALIATTETVAHKVIWIDYILGSLTGISDEPRVIQSSVRWIVLLTLFTACVPSMFIWSTLLSALLARPWKGALYQRAANLLHEFDNTRSIVEWGYTAFAIAIVGVSLVGIEAHEEARQQQGDITLGIYERNCERGIIGSCAYLGDMHYYGVGIDPDVPIAREFLEKACYLGGATSCTQLAAIYQGGRGGQQDFQRARELFEKACSLGDQTGCVGLGDLYQRGQGGEQDFQRARELFETACAQGAAEGCHAIGHLYLGGLGVESSSQRALESFETACNGGSANGCSDLGHFYRDRGTPPDLQRARGFFESACDGKSAKGCHGLGLLYWKGQGVERDLQRAHQLFELACAEENADGCAGLGLLYREGQGVGQDFRHAHELLERACREGSADGCSGLGQLHRDGQGVARDLRRAHELFERACKEGSADGCSDFGQLHRDGLGVARNFLNARTMFELACNRGSGRGCTGLGGIYRRAQGVERDFRRARELYEIACTRGDLEGCNNLGVLYRRGQGGEKDFQRARELYEGTCNQGNPIGCNNLGILYREGEGVEQDFERARALYEFACNEKQSQGCRELGILYREGQGVEQDFQRARALFEIACNYGNPTSCSDLGELYEQGQGVEQDDERARQMFEMACKRGSSRACESLSSGEGGE
jgi:TPR repeat protein